MIVCLQLYLLNGDHLLQSLLSDGQYTVAVKKNGMIIGRLLSIMGLLVVYEERKEDTMYSDRRSLLASRGLEITPLY